MTYRHEKHFTIAEAIQSLYDHHSMIEKMQDLSGQLLAGGYDIHQTRPAAVQQNLPREFSQLLDVIWNL